LRGDGRKVVKGEDGEGASVLETIGAWLEVLRTRGFGLELEGRVDVEARESILYDVALCGKSLMWNFDRRATRDEGAEQLRLSVGLVGRGIKSVDD